MSIAPFSIGTSSTAVPVAAQSMDLSLDELIAARRSSASTPKNNRRKSLKSTTGSASKKDDSNNRDQKKSQNLQRALGTNRAKRNAKTAARRGLSNNSKPDPKSIEREVYRLQRTPGGVGTRFEQPRRSTRIRNNNNKENSSNNNNSRNNNRNNSRSAIDRKIKAKNLGRNNTKRNNNNQIDSALKAPSKKAFNAAVKAMNTAGFQAPKGMKMVISFAPTENNNNKNTNNRRGQNNRGRRN